MSASPLTIPGVHLLHLADLVERWGVTREALFADDVPELSALEGPRARVEIATLERVVERARALTSEPALGMHLGMLMRITAHGHLGFAVMTAATVGDALALAVRFQMTRTDALTLSLEREAERVALVVHEQCDFGAARDAVMVALLVGIWRMGEALTARPLEGDVEVRFAAPSYAVVLCQIAPGEVRFAQRRNALCFSEETLALPIALADPVAQTLALEQCERELATFCDASVTRLRVREALLTPQGLRDLSSTARALALSPRTLKRRLAASGTTFRAVRDAVAAEAAARWIREGRLTVEQIAERLGYANAANFNRAFRRWYGTSPRAWLREGR